MYVIIISFYGKGGEGGGISLTIIISLNETLFNRSEIGLHEDLEQQTKKAKKNAKTHPVQL